MNKFPLLILIILFLNSCNNKKINELERFTIAELENHHRRLEHDIKMSIKGFEINMLEENSYEYLDTSTFYKKKFQTLAILTNSTTKRSLNKLINDTNYQYSEDTDQLIEEHISFLESICYDTTQYSHDLNYNHKIIKKNIKCLRQYKELLFSKTKSNPLTDKRVLLLFITYMDITEEKIIKLITATGFSCGFDTW